MNCAVHSDVEAAGFCSRCGKPLCAACARDVRGARYCEPCLSSMVAQADGSAPQTPERSPWVAFGLGWIPGLGAVYNGEYIKALVHVAIFAGLITLDSRGSDQPFWGLATAFFTCYMPIEAFITARNNARNRLPFDAPVKSTDYGLGSAPVGPIVLIVLGALFLLDNLHVLDFDRVFENGWPVLLIGLGGWMLWQRTRKSA